MKKLRKTTGSKTLQKTILSTAQHAHSLAVNTQNFQSSRHKGSISKNPNFSEN